MQDILQLRWFVPIGSALKSGGQGE